MDTPPRIPSRTPQQATQQADGLHQTTGNSAPNTAKNNTAGPVPQAAGNLGQRFQVEIGQTAHSEGNRKPSRVSINESANVTLHIPSRKETLVDMLMGARFQVSQSTEQNRGTTNNIPEGPISVLVTAIDLLKIKIEERGDGSRAERKQLKEDTLKLIGVADKIIETATNNHEPAQRSDVAPRPPTRTNSNEPAQRSDAAPRLPTRR